MSSEIFHTFRGLLKQPPPEVLNFQVNDICNARCVMCNIWQNKRGTELDPAQFSQLLKHPFFQQVKHVGITGGEPTLRSDLHLFYEGLIDTLPMLRGASFITNGFKSAEAIATYGQVHRRYVESKFDFSGMVSIDGVGVIHDRVRGRPGSFVKATATLFGLREAGVPVHAACTIVKSNVWGLHELLKWGQHHGVYLRFRVGEFIRRLYNEQRRDEIRAFDEAEICHLVGFFHKLLHEYETEERVQRTYTSILSLLTGGDRLITCPYQTSQSLNVDSQGKFAICAPRGTPHALGAAPERSTRRAWERLQVRRKYCPRCIHDYHGDWTAKEAGLRLRSGATALTLASLPEPPPKQITLTARRTGEALIIGWYGTETAGDIAIFAGLALQFRELGINRLTVLSLNPFYSRTTLQPLSKELNLQIEVRAYDDSAVFGDFARFEFVSMGGGPLMDIDPVELVRSVFRHARAAGVRCRIDGCGIGPLFQPRFKDAVAELLQLAATVRLRDAASLDFARALVPALNGEVISDPSATYLNSLGIRWQGAKTGVIRGFLRMLTHEYRQETTPAEATEITVQFLRRVLAWFPAHRLELCAMHYFPVGWDDREFAQSLVEQLDDPRVSVDWVPRTPREILERMATAEINLCMRFHSVVFAHAIEAPFAALDYTAGGKIEAFLRTRELGQLAIRFPELKTLDQPTFLSKLSAPVPVTG